MVPYPSFYFRNKSLPLGSERTSEIQAVVFPKTKCQLICSVNDVTDFATLSINGKGVCNPVGATLGVVFSTKTGRFVEQIGRMGGWPTAPLKNPAKSRQAIWMKNSKIKTQQEVME